LTGKNKMRIPLGIFLYGFVLCGQDLRTDQIESARSQKELELAPPADPGLERAILRTEGNPIYRGITAQDGFGIGFGQLVPGAGFSLGPRYRRSFMDNHLHVAAFVDASAKKFYLAGATASLSGLWNGLGALDSWVTHSDFPQMPYYGAGPESRKTGRSDFRIENTEVGLRPAIHPIKRLSIGAIGTFTAINVGPGTASQFISSDRQYGPSVAPGIDRQTNYLKAGGFVAYDWRDRPGDSTYGGSYRAEYVKFSDQQVGAYSFYRLNLDAKQFIPLFNRKRVIALHAASWLTDTNRNQVVPFYMQPTLGGPDTMRGFSPFRFYDNNAVLVQGEYRWEASSVLGLALFADGGKVFHDWEQWNLHKLEGSFGFGLRIKTGSTVALRIDTGFSHEGVQVWFRVANPF
jgi:hypothetical protein